MTTFIEDDQDWESMPTLPPGFILNSYQEATKITPTSDPKTYSVDLKLDWGVGQVLFGGYLASLMAEVAIYYFQTKRKDVDQADIITCHLEFLNPPKAGPAEVAIHELKIGRQFSVVRVALLQIQRGKSKICIESLTTMGNISREAESGGISLPTNPASRLRPIPAFSDCDIWRPDPRVRPRRPIALKTNFYLPRGSSTVLAHPTLGPAVREFWVEWAESTGPKGFSVAQLLYLADNFRPLPEAFGLKNMWFPTLSYGLEIKRSPPTVKGWDMLFVRIEMNSVKDGRFDMSVQIFDKDGELVAMGNHTALILDLARAPKQSNKAALSKI